MERAYAKTRMGQLHFAIRHGTGTAPPLVLLPQGGRTWPMFEELMSLLSADRTCIAVDLPGSGASDPLPRGVTIEAIAATVADLLDDRGIDTASVYGIHTGNKIGAAFAANFGDRLHKLIFAGQSHSIVPSNSARSGTVGKERKRLLEKADAREAALVRWADVNLVFGKLWWNADLMRRIDDPEGRRRAVLRVVDEIGSSEGIVPLYDANFAYDLEGDLSRISAPTLIVEIASPEEDARIGRQGAALLGILPDAELAVIEEPDMHGNTLEGRSADLAVIIDAFLSR